MIDTFASTPYELEGVIRTTKEQSSPSLVLESLTLARVVGGGVVGQ